MRNGKLSARHFSEGFSAVELIVSSTILLIAVVAVASLFESGNRMAKAENNVSDEQQSARYAAYQLVMELRMAGAGGLPPSGISAAGVVGQIAVSLNFGSSTYGTASKFASNNVNVATDTVLIGGTHHVKAGTDVIHVRGVISTPVYDLSGSNWTPGTPAGGGTLIISPCSKWTDTSLQSPGPCGTLAVNDMSALLPSNAASQNNRLFVMYDNAGNMGIALITTATATTTSGLTTATLVLDTTVNGYMLSLNPSGAFPIGLTSPTRGGIVDDRIFFIDDGTATGPQCRAANASTSPGPCHPVLSVADWNSTDTTTTPFSTATVTPIADDIEDLQVAYGVDFFDAQSATCNSYPTNCTLSAPAQRTDASGALLSYSDNSISITSRANYNTIVTAARGTTPPNQDPSESTTADGDEWIWNVAGEPTAGTFDRTSSLILLKALEVSILAKSKDPDEKYAGLGALSWPLMDSLAKTTSDATAGNGLAYRRRVETVRINIRNMQVQ